MKKEGRRLNLKAKDDARSIPPPSSKGDEIEACFQRLAYVSVISSAPSSRHHPHHDVVLAQGNAWREVISRIISSSCQRTGCVTMRRVMGMLIDT